MGRLIKNLKIDIGLHLHIKKALLDAEREGKAYANANDYIKKKLGMKEKDTTIIKPQSGTK